MVCEVNAVQPNSWAVSCDVFDVVELFFPVFGLRCAENVPADVEVVVGSPSRTEFGLAYPVWVVACGDVVSENGDVAEHVGLRWESSSDFRFDAEKVEIEAWNFLWFE